MNPGTFAAEDSRLVSLILDYAQPWSLNYFRLRKPLGPYRAGEFVDRITLVVLLEQTKEVVAS